MAYKNAPILSITWYTILIIKKLVSSCQNKFKITDVMWNIMTLIIIKPRKQTWHFTSNINFSYLMTSIFDLALWNQIPSLYSVQFFFMTNESLEWQTDYQRIHMVRLRCWRGSGPRWWASQSSRHTAAAADLPGSGTSRPIGILYRNIIHFSFVDENCLYMYIKCYNITCSFNFYM